MHSLELYTAIKRILKEKVFGVLCDGQRILFCIHSMWVIRADKKTNHTSNTKPKKDCFVQFRFRYKKRNDDLNFVSLVVAFIYIVYTYRCAELYVLSKRLELRSIDQQQQKQSENTSQRYSGKWKREESGFSRAELWSLPPCCCRYCHIVAVCRRPKLPLPGKCTCVRTFNQRISLAWATERIKGMRREWFNHDHLVYVTIPIPWNQNKV